MSSVIVIDKKLRKTKHAISISHLNIQTEETCTGNLLAS